MADQYSIVVGDFQANTLDDFVNEREVNGNTLRTEFSIEETANTAGDRKIRSGRILSERVESVRKFDSNNESWNTKEEFVLQLGDNDEIQLIDSSGSANSGADFKEVDEVTASIFEFHFIDEHVILIEGGRHDILEDILNIDVQPVTLPLDLIVKKLRNRGVLKSINQGNFSDIDDSVNSASVAGRQIESNFERFGEGTLTWVSISVNLSGQDLQIGLSRDKGSIVVFGPLNFPVKAIADFVIEFVLEHSKRV